MLIPPIEIIILSSASVSVSNISPTLDVDYIVHSVTVLQYHHVICSGQHKHQSNTEIVPGFASCPPQSSGHVVLVIEIWHYALLGTHGYIEQVSTYIEAKKNKQQI